MPEETYNIQLDADNVNQAILDVHSADSVPTASSDKMVRSGGLWTYLESLRPSTGFGVYTDTVYTEGVPMLVNNARVQFSCDTASYIDQLPTGITELWDVTDNSIVPENVGDGYNIRVDMRFKADALNSRFDLELDISLLGDGSNVILLDTVQCLKAANTEQRYTETHFIYSRETFVANHGRLFLNSTELGDTVSAYAMGITIARVHKAI